MPTPKKKTKVAKKVRIKKKTYKKRIIDVEGTGHTPGSEAEAVALFSKKKSVKVQKVDTRAIQADEAEAYGLMGDFLDEDRIGLDNTDLIEEINKLMTLETETKFILSFRAFQINARAMDLYKEYDVENMGELLAKIMPRMKLGSFRQYVRVHALVVSLGYDRDVLDDIYYGRMINLAGLMEAGIVNHDNFQSDGWLDAVSNNTVMGQLDFETKVKKASTMIDTKTKEESTGFSFRVPTATGDFLLESMKSFKNQAGTGPVRTDADFFTQCAAAWQGSHEGLDEKGAKTIGIVNAIEGIRRAYNVELVVLNRGDTDEVKDDLLSLIVAKVPNPEGTGVVNVLGATTESIADFYGCKKDDITPVPVDTACLWGAVLGRMEETLQLSKEMPALQALPAPEGDGAFDPIVKLTNLEGDPKKKTVAKKASKKKSKKKAIRKK